MGQTICWWCDNWLAWLLRGNVGNILSNGFGQSKTSPRANLVVLQTACTFEIFRWGGTGGRSMSVRALPTDWGSEFAKMVDMPIVLALWEICRTSFLGSDSTTAWVRPSRRILPFLITQMLGSESDSNKEWVAVWALVQKSHWHQFPP